METKKAIFRNSKEWVPSPVHLICEHKLICLVSEAESHVQYILLLISRHVALITHNAIKSVNSSIKCFVPSISISFKCECYIIMQMQ